LAYRNRLHILLGILLWAVFGYYWFLVIQRPVTPHTRFALTGVGSIVGGITVFLVFWVAHNIRIARRSNRRSARIPRIALPETDFLGREFIEHSEERLQHAPYIEVHLVEIQNEDEEGTTEHKLFRITSELPD